MPLCSRKNADWQCPREAAPGLKQCEEHLGQQRARGKRFRERRAEAGQCDSCKARALPGGTKCQVCREEYRKKYSGTPITVGQDEGDRLTVHWSLDELLKRQR